MNYPLISEYIDAIRYAEDNFEQLQSLRAVTDDDGNPVMSSGNFAVVFKMRDETDGRLYAIKCFLKDQERREESYKKITEELEFVSSAFITPVQYLEKELYVDTEQGDTKEFPVLKMDWIEGVPLDRYIREHINDKYALELLAYKFELMASWLMNQEFAHGDLKPDNILVQEDGHIVLVDYDGMFVPSMCGEKARELGSPDFRHPLRNDSYFDASIDDFSLASIALSLQAIALEPQLLNQYGAADRLLFSEEDYRNPAASEALKAVQTLTSNKDLSRLFGLFFIAHAENNLSHTSSKLFNMQKPEKPIEIPLSTEVTDEDKKNAVEDEYGVKYSSDGLRLIECPNDIKEYNIKDGTKVICDSAFFSCTLKSITIPNSVTSIGGWAFFACYSLQSIIIPNSVTSIGKNPFVRSGIENITCDSPFFIVKDNALYNHNMNLIISYWGKNIEFTIPNSVTSIRESVFYYCESLQRIFIPDSVRSIEFGAFCICSSLQSITIPNSITSIGGYAFFDCKSLQSITIPNSVTSIGENPFRGSGIRNITCNSPYFIVKGNALYNRNMNLIISYWGNDIEFTIPNSVTSIGNSAFDNCDSLQSITIPNSVTSIGNSAFISCKSLQRITIPNSVTSIGNGVFSECNSLQSIIIPNSITSIGNNAFEYCDSLRSITIPNSVTSIGDWAFYRCYSLRSITIPNSVTSIGKGAFCYCDFLQSITIPNSVTSIGNDAFFSFKSKQSINIPTGTKNKFTKLLKQSNNKDCIEYLHEI